MEIRNAVNEVKNEYPKIEQVSKKCLSNSVSRILLKVGLSSLGLLMLFKTNVFAVISPEIANPSNVQWNLGPRPTMLGALLGLVQFSSLVIFILTGLIILITKIKAKIQSKPKHVKKWVKILFITSIIIFILGRLARPFVQYYV